MSRSGYSEDLDTWSLICWRGAVKSALRGKRGQAFLAELVEALDALPEKRLIADGFEIDGEFCALGAVGRNRALPMDKLDPHDREGVSGAFGIAEAMAAEIMWINDEGSYYWATSPEQRFNYVRSWAISNLAPLPEPPNE